MTGDEDDGHAVTMRLSRSQRRAHERQAKPVKGKRVAITAEEAVKKFGFKDVQAVDIFALQMDAMMQHMATVKEVEPEMIPYIEEHFKTVREKIFAGMFVGAKITENAWIKASMK